MFFTNPESMNLFHEILGYIFRGLQGGFSVMINSWMIIFFISIETSTLKPVCDIKKRNHKFTNSRIQSAA